MNNIENFIKTHRNRFDQPPPPADLWKRIEAQLPPEPTAKVKPLNSLANRSVFDNPRFVRRLLVASLTGLLLLAGLWAVNWQYGVAHQPEVVAVSPSYAQEFVQYARLIDNKRDELCRMTQANPDLYRQFSGDLDKLEAGYQSLKADLPQNPNQELLIQAMIQNLQLQIDLLNQQLHVIQEMKQQTAPRHASLL